MKTYDCKLIVLNTSRYGGISDYLHFQANALADLGVKVTMVGVAGTEKSQSGNYDFVPLWKEPRVTKNRFLRRVFFARNLLSNIREFAKFVKQRNDRFVLFGGFFEYLSPLWAWRFKRLMNEKRRIGTIIHDPVRDYIVGPEWWHKRSVTTAFSVADIGFVHGPADVVEGAGDLRIVSVPLGLLPFPDHKTTGQELRESLGIPGNVPVVLYFGHIRDGKNLDLLIRAISEIPEIHLIVAGSAQSSGQKPASFYVDLAKKLGVSERCHFEVRFIEDDEVGTFHEASDLIAVTYSSDFRSASAALSTCIHYRKSCIASSGPGPLKNVIEKYDIGLWVEPDSYETIRNGLSRLIKEPRNPKWDRFQQENSWNENARLVMEAFSDSRAV